MSHQSEEPICPACGSPAIKSLGYNYDLAKIFYECEDCEENGDTDHFNPVDEEE